MASQSLYRKWRSQAFAEMVGQDAVIRTLKNALSAGNLAHAYLFAGPRGTGKTTTARLLAKTINCLHPQGSEPCNACQQCREITAGNSFNVIEIDAASNRGIDSIRELREKVMVPPAAGRYKVYILDEAHMLTTEAFNALLKTLEEPPEHAIFVLATTDVHKMLPTVISRCQRFDFKRFTVRQIIGHLNFVARQEQVELESGAAELIARAAAGGMRDALSLLDQAIAYAGQQITLAQVQAMLGVADPRAIQKFILHIAQLDSPGGLHLIHKLVEAGADLRQMNAQVAEYWRAMMLAKAGANIAEILDHTEDEVREIVEAARLFSLEEIMECARIFAQNDLMQKNQGTPQLGLELALLAAIEMHRRGRSEQPARSSVPASTPPQPAPVPPRPPVPPTGAAPASTPPAPAQPLQAMAVQAHKQERQALPDWDEIPTRDDGMEAAPAASTPPETAAVAAQAALPAEEPAPSLTVAQAREKWGPVLRRVRTRSGGAKIEPFLRSYTVVAIEGTQELPVVVIQAQADFHYQMLHQMLQKAGRQEIIEWALKMELGQECHIRLLPPDGPVQSMLIPLAQPQAIETANGNSRGMPEGGAARQPPSPGPSTPPKPAAPSRKREQPAQGGEQKPSSRGDSASAASASGAPPPSALARTERVRENNNAASSHTRDAGETRLEGIRKKATGDPVVREVVRLFKAEIQDKNIQLK